jgi:hypothetical protein
VPKRVAGAGSDPASEVTWIQSPPCHVKTNSHLRLGTRALLSCSYIYTPLRFILAQPLPLLFSDLQADSMSRHSPPEADAEKKVCGEVVSVPCGDEGKDSRDIYCALSFKLQLFLVFETNRFSKPELSRQV